MTTATETPQHMRSLRRAQQVAHEAAEQRDALVGRPVSEVVVALIHPTPELAALTLRRLFRTGGVGRSGPVPGLGPRSLQRAFTSLAAKHPNSGRRWHDRLRLRDLSETERRHLVRAVVERGERSWREAVPDHPDGEGEG